MDEIEQVDLNSTLTFWLSFQIIQTGRYCARHKVQIACGAWRFMRVERMGRGLKGFADNEILSRISNNASPALVHQSGSRRCLQSCTGCIHAAFLETAGKMTWTILVLKVIERGFTYGCGPRKWRYGCPKPPDRRLSDVKAKFGASGEAS